MGRTGGDQSFQMAVFEDWCVCAVWCCEANLRPITAALMLALCVTLSVAIAVS